MTTVVVTQPVVQQMSRGLLVGSVRGTRDWDSGIFSCFNDCISSTSYASYLTPQDQKKNVTHMYINI